MKGSLKLAACLDTLATRRLAADLASQRGHSLTLDAADVTFLGTLPLQLLLAAHRQWRMDGKSFRIADPSAAFLDGTALLGSNPAALGAEVAS
ncbi:MAG TPA: STAS domain-containing protein [Paracoccus sp.]|nr:STAS domain-containing protein [Paracoccus sp. (in: a-proteobacteria)]